MEIYPLPAAPQLEPTVSFSVLFLEKGDLTTCSGAPVEANSLFCHVLLFTSVSWFRVWGVGCRV